MEPYGQARASTPKCLPSPERLRAIGVNAQRRGLLRRRMILIIFDLILINAQFVHFIF
jgi:hypothetical protein